MNSESIRYEGSSESNHRGSRWPMISRPNNAANRTTPADDKVRRSQVC